MRVTCFHINLKKASDVNVMRMESLVAKVSRQTYFSRSIENHLSFMNNLKLISLISHDND